MSGEKGTGTSGPEEPRDGGSQAMEVEKPKDGDRAPGRQEQRVVAVEDARSGTHRAGLVMTPWNVSTMGRFATPRPMRTSRRCPGPSYFRGVSG